MTVSETRSRQRRIGRVCGSIRDEYPHKACPDPSSSEPPRRVFVPPVMGAPKRKTAKGKAKENPSPAGVVTRGGNSRSGLSS